MGRLEKDGKRMKWKNWWPEFKRNLYGLPEIQYNWPTRKFPVKTDIKWYRVKLTCTRKFIEDNEGTRNFNLPKRFALAYRDYHVDTFIFILQPFHIIVPWIIATFLWYKYNHARFFDEVNLRRYERAAWLDGYKQGWLDGYKQRLKQDPETHKKLIKEFGRRYE